MRSEEERWDNRWRKDIRVLLIVLIFAVLVVGALTLIQLAGVEDAIRDLTRVD